MKEKVCSLIFALGAAHILALTAPAWGEPTPAAGIVDDELLVAKPDQYSSVVDRAVDCLKRGDVACFRGMLSEETIRSETRGSGVIDTIIKTRFVPFFADCTQLTDTVTTLPTRDAANNQGLAIFRTCETSSDVEKPFVMYVISEHGSLVVGNLLLNKTLEDIRESPSR